MTELHPLPNNLNAPLERLGGDWSLLQQLAMIFIDDVEVLMAQLEQATREQEYSDAVRTAHSIKGLASTFDAVPVMTTASLVEASALQNDVDPGMVDTLREEVNMLKVQLDERIIQNPAPA